MIRSPRASSSWTYLLGVARRGDCVEHRQHARRRAAVQRAGERADRGREARGAVGAGRRGDARGERRGVHAVLGGGDPVDVERLRLARRPPRRASGSGTARPRSCPARPRLAGTGGSSPRSDWATIESAADESRARSSRAWSASMSTSCFRPHCAASVGSVAWRSIARVAGVGDGLDVGRRQRQPAVERLVDDEAPDLLEGDVAGELLDVDAAVAERRAFLVRLGDLRLEGDDALEPQVGGGAHSAHSCESALALRAVRVEPA